VIFAMAAASGSAARPWRLGRPCPAFRSSRPSPAVRQMGGNMRSIDIIDIALGATVMILLFLMLFAFAI